MFFTYLFIYLIIYWLQTAEIYQETNLLSASQEFSTFYGTRKFIPTFTSARQLSLTWVISIQHIPLYITPWKSVLIIFCRLSLGLKVDFSFRFPHQNPV